MRTVISIASVIVAGAINIEYTSNYSIPFIIFVITMCIWDMMEIRFSK